MKIVIPYADQDKLIILDVVARLGVLYPNFEIVDDIGSVSINAPESTDHETVKQTALDQLIRSRFDARTVKLRENLYKKLLG